ncbi:MAG: FAD-dependent oxidoreductase [Candidatus Hydrogenedentes bacterium]|nr:FAD-dependent oxidoreductase [Candidatus Hydrogenedentota bacterium]
MRSFPHCLPALIALAASALSAPAETHNYDVVVYGGTAGGAVAAIAAADEGRRTLLIEPRHHIGGMTSGGLGRTDFGDMSVIGGRAKQFYERLGKHYGEKISWYFEPHQAERVLREWLEASGVTAVFGSRLDRVEKDGTTIRSITLLNGETYAAPIFIDCSYEGDLLPRAGISYTWGREGRDQYGESLAGKVEYCDKHQFDVPVNPYDENGNVLPLIQPDDGLKPGDSDKKVQAYNFRMCLSSDTDNQLPFPKPDGYDPARWEILKRYLAARPGLTIDDVLIVSPMPNNKTDINNRGPISTDYIGGSWDYPEASYAEQDRIWKEHEDYVKGFFYFMANDPSVPKTLQDEFNRWGLAKDEFTDTGGWPHQLYVREARRMIGDYVMRQKDLQEERTKPDTIGMGSYNSDSHHVQRFVADGSPLWEKGIPSLLNEGDVQVPVKPYEMAYRSFVPQKAECTNLLVGSTFSASHVAYSSMRMEPQYMIIGEAAGIAASLAIEAGVPVQDIDVKALQDKLRANGAVLRREDTRAPYTDVRDLAGIVVDDDDAVTEGEWFFSRNAPYYVGYEYLHEMAANSADTKARYTPDLPKDGWYEVRVSYSVHENRATRAKVLIQTAAGQEIQYVNQREQHGEHAPFLSLGTYPFKKGTSGYVEIQGGPDAGGFVIADAVQWIPKD